MTLRFASKEHIIKVSNQSRKPTPIISFVCWGSEISDSTPHSIIYYLPVFFFLFTFQNALFSNLIWGLSPTLPFIEFSIESLIIQLPPTPHICILKLWLLFHPSRFATPTYSLDDWITYLSLGCSLSFIFLIALVFRLKNSLFYHLKQSEDIRSSQLCRPLVPLQKYRQWIWFVAFRYSDLHWPSFYQLLLSK